MSDTHDLIVQHAINIASRYYRGGDEIRIRLAVAHAMMEMRDHMEQRGEWKPVIDEAVPDTSPGGSGVDVLQNEDGVIAVRKPGRLIWVQLPDHIRLCRRTSSEETSDE